MWSATRRPRVLLAMAAATFVLVGAACGGDGGSGGETDPTAYPTPWNLGFGVPIYPGAEYSPPPAGHTTLRVVVYGGKSYDKQSHEFYAGEPWAAVAAWYRDTFDDPGLETEKGMLGGRETTWTVDQDDVGWTDVHVAEARPAVTAIIIFRNTYVVAK